MDEGGYGRFAALSRQELERYCYLDDKDWALIAARRRDYNRLGFAVQVVTVRNLGNVPGRPGRCSSGAGPVSGRAAGHRRSLVCEAVHRTQDDPVRASDRNPAAA